jgi:hypothetical protein
MITVAVQYFLTTTIYIQGKSKIMSERPLFFFSLILPSFITPLVYYLHIFIEEGWKLLDKKIIQDMEIISCVLKD